MAKQQPAKGAAVRWAINADGEGGLAILLQALPVSAASLNNRPCFKRDICPGVPLFNFPINVDIDYNPGLIGPKPRFFSTAPDTTEKILKSSISSRHNLRKGNKNTNLYDIFTPLFLTPKKHEKIYVNNFFFTFRHRSTA